MHAAIIAAFAASAAFAACACGLPFRRLPPPLVTRMLQKRQGLNRISVWKREDEVWEGVGEGMVTTQQLRLLAF